jgi:hypothetical protein
MADRELLEKAAKAAGYKRTRVAENGLFQVHGWHEGYPDDWEYWNPRDDDGEALRLAVKCQIQVHYDEFTGCAFVRWNRGEKYDSLYGSENPCAATRLAILRAAAAMAGD